MIAISDNERSISYQELNDIIKKKIQILKQHNLEQHRIMIVSQGSTKTIDDYEWVLAVIKNGGCAATITTKQSELEYQGKLVAGKISAVIKQNTIQIINEAPSKLGDEIYLCYTSGSTRKNFYECYPYFWERNGYKGTNIEDCIDLASRLGCHQSLNQIYEAPFDCAYGVDTLLKSYATNGRFHIINDYKTFDYAVEQVKPNYMSGFPNSIKRMVEHSQGAQHIPYWEIGGGYFAQALVEKIFAKFNAKSVCNLFASSSSGYNLAKIIHSPQDDIQTMQPLGYVQTELRNGTLYYKHAKEEWCTDGDQFDATEHGYTYVGRSDDAFYNFENGIKIYTNEIESKALEMQNVHEAYCVLNMDKNKHNLMYCGDATLEQVSLVIKQLTPYKIPHKIVKVNPRLFTRHEKISKIQLPYTLQENPDDYIDQIILK